MASVTQRIKQIKQPRGGYINPNMFTIDKMDSLNNLNDTENIHASLIGLAVDYLTRFMNGTKVEDSFRISLMGANIINQLSNANNLLNTIKGLDDNSIISACKLVGYDVCYRAGVMGYRPVEEILPDKSTIENIKIMVERSLSFIELFGPIILDGFTFEGGYTNTINTGDGDFLTTETLWDFKVSKSKPTKDHTLQLLIYSIMGKKSIHKEFENIKKLGIYNPRLNIVYTLDMKLINKDLIETISSEVIGY